MKTLLLIGALSASAAAAPKPCEVPGRAVHWAYDSCMFLHETDDELHPGVLACAGKAEKIIKRHGSCTAKRIFKERICAARERFGYRDQTRVECMLDPEVKGLAVRNDGL